MSYSVCGKTEWQWSKLSKVSGNQGKDKNKTQIQLTVKTVIYPQRQIS